MAKIRNSMAPNMYGKGQEKILTLDNGDEYIIRNSMAPNMYGDGNEQEIVKKNSSTDASLWADVIIFAGGLICMGILWLIFNIM